MILEEGQAARYAGAPIREAANLSLAVLAPDQNDSMQIPKIGFGTWTIGGQSAPDDTLETPSLAALRSALDLGYTHFDTAEVYAAGHSEELLGQAIRQAGIALEALFITSKVSPEHLHFIHR